MESACTAQEYALGLDIGSASIGWAIVGLDESRTPVNLIRAGVRIFEPGVEGSALNIEEGKDKSRAVERRTARLQRRQIRRRVARQRDLFLLLQCSGLLPQSDPAIRNLSEQRHDVLNRLDRELVCCERNESAQNGQAEQLLPYVLRKAALDRKLAPFQLGRVLYHLCQRRGFKSARRAAIKGKDKEEELGKVKAGISELEQQIKSSGARTLGEFFAGRDPHAQRVRCRWTARKMFEHEFEQIWSKQQEYSPSILTPDLKARIGNLLFYQRPIAKQEHLIGHCELEEDQHRAPWASLEAQRFRLLQRVNDLRIIAPGSSSDTELTLEQRRTLLDKLESDGDQTFSALRRLLKLPAQSAFNLERGGEKKIPGNRTNQLMRAAFGERWDNFSAEEKHRVVEYWRDEDSEEKLAEEAQRRWDLDAFSAHRFASREPEGGYCSLSLKAIRKLLPLMEKGIPFKTAEKEVYGDRLIQGEPKQYLPIVRSVIPELRNPAVERALTELRKLVNAILREYKRKPYEIRIEMARELRKSRHEREGAARRMRQQRERREAAEAKIKAIIPKPSRDDVDRALLFEECGGVCPYTGKTIQFSSLFGGESQFDVEHIVPRSRCPDDSFLNKTLCYHEENRNTKGGQTPWEAYGRDDQHWNEILLRIRSWKPGNPAKLRRFELKSTDQIEEFTARQLNDTRYTTRLAAELLETLYGGRYQMRDDGTRRQTVFATTGMITHQLRRAWCLESILGEALSSANGESKGKPRTDHRHHAVDAIVIALSSSRTVQWMNTAAAKAPAWQQNGRALKTLQSPWPDFVDSIRPHIENMIASHRPSHKMSGALHKDTYYGKPYTFRGKEFVNLRRPLTGLSGGQIANIVDDCVKRAVIEKLAELGGDSKQFDPANPVSLPFLAAKDGTRIPIRKVRVREAKSRATLIALRAGFVQSEEIHHFELFVSRQRQREKWTHVAVTLFDACERKRRGRDVVNRALANDPEANFLFSLMKGDLVELNFSGGRQIFRVKKFYAAGSIWFAHVNNAQKDEDQKKDKTRWPKTPDKLRELNPRKVTVDLLGRVHPAK